MNRLAVKKGSDAKDPTSFQRKDAMAQNP